MSDFRRGGTIGLRVVLEAIQKDVVRVILRLAGPIILRVNIVPVRVRSALPAVVEDHIAVSFKIGRRSPGVNTRGQIVNDEADKLDASAVHIRPVGASDVGRKGRVIGRQPGFRGRGSDLKIYEPGVGAENFYGWTGTRKWTVDRPAKATPTE